MNRLKIKDLRLKNKPNNQRIKRFTDLIVWQKGHQLVLLIYRLTKKFPKEETYSLVDQMRRSVSSITSNIAEGFGRQTYKDKLRFYYQAQGSLIELKNQIIIAKDVGYINEKEYLNLSTLADEVHKLLQGLIRKSKTFLNLES